VAGITAELTVPTAGLPSRGMTAIVTDLPITGRPVIGDSGSTPVYCAAQFNVSFLRS
jgi:hypothetical protein